MRDLGIDAREVSEWLRNADRAWLVEHPEEHDPDEYFTIAKYDSAYSIMSDRRIGFSIDHAESQDEVVRQLVGRGFAEPVIRAQLAEVERLWERDARTNRRSLDGVTDVARRGEGYVVRNFGTASWWPDPMTQGALRKMLTHMGLESPRIDALIERADREAQ